MARMFRGRRPRRQACVVCGERLILHSWRETDWNPAGRRSVKTCVYIHPSTGFVNSSAPREHDANAE